MRKLYFQLPLVPMGGSWPVALGIPLFVYGTLIPRHRCLHVQVKNLGHITLVACLFLIVEVSVAVTVTKSSLTLYAHVSFWKDFFFYLSGQSKLFYWSFWWYVRSQIDYLNKTETSLCMIVFVVGSSYLGKRPVLDGIWCFTRQGSSAHLFISSPLIALIIYELLDAGHKNWVLCIAWSPDGKHLVSGSKAGELQCWDPQTGKPSGNQLVVKSLYARIADSSYPTWVGCQFQFWHALEAFRCNSFHLTVSNTMYVVVLLLVGSNSLVVS